MAEAELFKNFRYLLLDISDGLTEDECGRIAYGELGERDTQNPKLDVLCKLEAQGRFSPLNPHGLLEILERNKLPHLSVIVKDYSHSVLFKKVEKENKRWKRKSGRRRSTDISNESKELLEIKMHADPQEMLKDSFRVTLIQASLLLKHVELLREKVARKEEAEAAFKIVKKAEEAAETLGRTLRKALSAAGLKSGRASSSSEESDISPVTEEQPQLSSTQGELSQVH